MTNELAPKIWEFEVHKTDTPDLVLDYYCNSRDISFAPVAGAIEAIIGVEFVDVAPEGQKMRVIARNTPKVYNQLAPLFEKILGITPRKTWNDCGEWLL